jgi:hypothetical protein
MIKIVKTVKNPQILVVTPLLPEHKISKETKISVKRNKTPFFWIASEGQNNIPTNALNGIEWFKSKYGKLPPFYIMIDRDIEMGRGMLDKLYDKLKNKPENIGYCYASFGFRGHINRDFPAEPFDINRLLQSNYISSNSMFRTNVVETVGLVTDDKYKRLLDWAFLIKCFSQGFIGIPEPRAGFIAHSTEKDISAGSDEDYKVKYMRVFEDFIRPLIKSA